MSSYKLFQNSVIFEESSNGEDIMRNSRSSVEFPVYHQGKRIV